MTADEAKAKNRVLCVRIKTGEEKYLPLKTTQSKVAMELGGWEVVGQKIDPKEFLQKMKAKQDESDNERNELVAKYTELYGKAPNHQIGIVKLKEKIEQRELELENQKQK